MKPNRTAIAAALCCMALTSGAAFADDYGNKDRGMDNRTSSTTMDRSGMNMPGYNHGGAMNHQTVRQVQEALASKGHNPGPVDGIMGPRTRAALQDYQRAQNLTVSNDLNERTLESLGVQASAGGDRYGANPAVSDSGASAGGVGGSYGGAGGARDGADASAGGASVPPAGMNENPNGMGNDASRSGTTPR